MTDKPIGTRTGVARVTKVTIELSPDEVPDQTKRFGSTVFAPHCAVLFYRSDDGRAWIADGATIYGKRRLKSGGVSEDQRFDESYYRLDDAPVWLRDLSGRHWPAPVVDDDLPIAQVSATDLDGS